jgi:TatD DNase family protein
MYIDSHCHLNHRKLAGTPAEIVARANAAGVEGMLTICCRIREEFDDILNIAKSYDNVWCTVGTHPHDAGKPGEMAITQEELVAMTKHPKVIGIGESGLDYFYKNSSPEDQAASFRKHIRACIETGLPLVVHARDADDDVIRIIREEGQGTALKGVMHCFSSSPKMGFEALDLGFFISFSGIVTFGKSNELRTFAKSVPQNRILIETDAPYLAPEPHRGAVNEPALVVHTCAKVAELKGTSPQEMASISRANFFDLFHKAKSGAVAA